MDAMGYSSLFFFFFFFLYWHSWVRKTSAALPRCPVSPLKIVLHSQSKPRCTAEQCWQQLRVTHPAAPVGHVGGHPGAGKIWQRLRPVHSHKICPQSPQTMPSSPPTPSTLGGCVCHRHGGPRGWTPSGRPCRRRPCHPSWPDTRPLLRGLWPSHRLS